MATNRIEPADVPDVHAADRQLTALQHVTVRQLRLLIGLKVVTLWLLYLILVVLWMASMQRRIAFPDYAYIGVITVCGALGLVGIAATVWLFRTA